MLDEQYVKDKYPIVRAILEENCAGVGVVATLLRLEIERASCEVELALLLQEYCIGQFRGTVRSATIEDVDETLVACMDCYDRAAADGDDQARTCAQALRRALCDKAKGASNRGH